MLKKVLVSLLAAFMMASSCTLFASAAQVTEPIEFTATGDSIIFASDTLSAKQIDYLRGNNRSGVAEVNIEPRFRFISSCGLGFNPDGNKVEVAAYTNYYSDIATSAFVEVTIERYVNGSWNFYRRWSDTSYTDLPAQVGAFTITVPAGRYRCTSLHTATDGTYTDNKTIDSGEKNIG